MVRRLIKLLMVANVALSAESRAETGFCNVAVSQFAPSDGVTRDLTNIVQTMSARLYAKDAFKIELMERSHDPGVPRNLVLNVRRASWLSKNVLRSYPLNSVTFNSQTKFYTISFDNGRGRIDIRLGGAAFFRHPDWVKKPVSSDPNDTLYIVYDFAITGTW